MATSDSVTEYSFSLDVLMDEIMRINQLRVKEIHNKDNSILFENYAIKESDEETIIFFVKNAVYDIVDVTAPLMSGLTGAVKNENPYGVVVKNLGNANSSVKESVENSFKQVIVSSVLMQWYEMKGLVDDMKLWAMKLERLKKEVVSKRLMQLKIR